MNQLKIGDFAKLAHVSVQTIRHYAKLGLLLPSDVDSATGYRYYALEQLERLHRIQALKDLGLGLRQIRSLLDEGVSAQDLEAMLRLKREELKANLQEQEERLSRVEARLALSKGTNPVNLATVVLKSLPSQRAIMTGGTINTIGEITPLFIKLDDHLERHRVSPAGACLALIAVPEIRLTDKPYSLEVVTPVASFLPDTDEVRLQTLPAVPLAASLLHSGPYETLAETYDKLFSWMDTHAYRVVGAAREVYLRLCDAASLYPNVYLSKNPEDFLTEVHLPVAKAHEA